MGVGVGGADVAGGAEDFADILGEVPAVGEPGAVFADGKGAGGGDVRCRHRAVAGAFRAIVIHYPIHRGQASFVDGDDFFRKRGGELRDDLLVLLLFHLNDAAKL